MNTSEIKVMFEGKEVLYNSLSRTQKKLLAEYETSPEVLQMLASENSPRIRAALCKRTDAIPARLLISLIDIETDEKARKRYLEIQLTTKPIAFILTFMQILFSDSYKAFKRIHESHMQERLDICLKTHILKYPHVEEFLSKEKIPDYLEIINYATIFFDEVYFRQFILSSRKEETKNILETRRWIHELSTNCEARGNGGWFSVIKEALKLFEIYQTEGQEAKDKIVLANPHYYYWIDMALDDRFLLEKYIGAPWYTILDEDDEI